MIQAKVNDKKEYALELSDQSVKINDEEFALEYIRLDKDRFHFVQGDKAFKVKVLQRGDDHKSIRLLVNQNEYQVELSDDMDLLLSKMGMSAGAGAQVNEVKAPMPGMVLKVEVEPGQGVKKGDPLLVLEAMKMENVIKSPGDAIVKSIPVSPQDKVEKNAVLVEFEA